MTTPTKSDATKERNSGMNILAVAAAPMAGELLQDELNSCQ
jgi:hypothetical protein